MKLAAPSQVQQLVERFGTQREAYLHGPYNETQVRREFIDPLFEALGWDVANKAGFAEAYKDTIHEDAVKVGGLTKAPDCSFRIGGTRKFFLEAKRPSVDIENDGDAAFQLRRYGWSAKLSLSVLTNFDQLSVYDCRVKPIRTDKASTARVLRLKHTEYLDRWDDLASLFSKGAVQTGAFDRFAATTRLKRGTAPIDSAFLAEIEDWRKSLAQNIALRNPRLAPRELNFAVQQTIDRVIFLRIAEDRGIEPYGRLQALQNGENTYSRLFELFARADVRYNSGLFHFTDEVDQASEPDRLTPRLKIDDKVLKNISRGLYYPESPYEFSVISADILGKVYEQFLGKVIKLSPAHHARIEEKIEVRKAGGVYYTPPYIVDYIVDRTVGRLVASRTPRQAAPVRILDPACGSGSFLIAAYQYLLDWYRDRYVENRPEQYARGRRPLLYRGRGGEWRLTTPEKKRILLNHIYGVDIDPQAVEVTKLSLLLKLLESETDQNLRLFPERVLPDLSGNVKCGNSLIDSDFDVAGQQSLAFAEEERHRINAFNWKHMFPSILNTGGFDAVIGNPPYIRIQTLKEWAPIEVEYYKHAYKAAAVGNYDIYVVFVERGFSLLKAGGRLGFILPHKFFNAQYGEPLRALIAKSRSLSEVVHFGDQQVFEDGTTYTCLLILDKSGTNEVAFAKVTDLADWRTTHSAERHSIPAARVTAGPWNFSAGKGVALIDKLSEMPLKLGNVADVFVGLQTSADDVFILRVISRSGALARVHSQALGEERWVEHALLAPVISGTDVRGYEPLPERQFILFPYMVQDERPELIPFSALTRKYPKTAEYLTSNKRRLTERESGRFDDAEWYRFGRNQNLGIQRRVKLCVPRLVQRLHAGFDHDGSHFLDNVDVGGITLKPDFRAWDLRYLLALLNSSLLRWFFPSIAAPFRGGYWSANRQFLSQLPLPDFTRARESNRDAKIIVLVDRMLELHKARAKARIATDREVLSRQITATAAQIDAVIYELYDLSPEDIGLLEESAAVTASAPSGASLH